jgi:hypothetical protein
MHIITLCKWKIVAEISDSWGKDMCDDEKQQHGVLMRPIDKSMLNGVCRYRD